MEPTSKAHEKTLNNIETRIDYSPDLMNFIYKKMRQFGFIDSGNAKVQVVKFHERFCLNNDDWPSTVNYTEMYRRTWEYFTETGLCNIEDFSDAIIDVSKKMIQEQKEAEKKPEHVELPETETNDNARGTVNKWTDKQLLNTWKTIQALYGTEMIRKRIQSPNANIFTKNVFKELEKRGLINGEEFYAIPD